MGDIIRNLLSNERRFQVARPGLVDLRVETQADGSTEQITAELVELSHGGARLRTDEPVAVKDMLQLEIGTDGLAHSLTVAGEVCWITPTHGGHFFIGCNFRPRIPDDVLQALATSGVLDRRSHFRELISLKTSTRWESHDGDTDVWLLNYSRGGVCLLARAAGHTGSRLSLEVRDDRDKTAFARAKAQWQVKTDEGYVIGCEFLNKQSYLLLKRYVAAANQARAIKRGLWRGGSEDGGVVGCEGGGVGCEN